MKVTLFVLLAAALLVSSGCAVIDFLDGKHIQHTPDYDRPRYNTGYGSGGGHSH
ncbi:hypothetical protein KI811_15935 [Geobacter hydrogenophilus]|uniref:hypothetical protein n=1 Tax=Geobacter hydrogenophilus TaxID=40983 RepID=UPI001BDB5816|nr:hypothetical protein [Geobacter hydrogenophilus]MBT0895298.1 hypothetical protein [Geobacter hydrogenophilus]